MRSTSTLAWTGNSCRCCRERSRSDRSGLVFSCCYFFTLGSGFLTAGTTAGECDFSIQYRRGAGGNTLSAAAAPASTVITPSVERTYPSAAFHVNHRQSTNTTLAREARTARRHESSGGRTTSESLRRCMAVSGCLPGCLPDYINIG
jgi:hypothetical protein